jgi:hypothetical protein
LKAGLGKRLGFVALRWGTDVDLRFDDQLFLVNEITFWVTGLSFVACRSIDLDIMPEPIFVATK